MSPGEALGWTGAVLMLPAIVMIGIGAFVIEDSTADVHEKAGIGLMLAGFALGVTVLTLWIIAIWTNVK